MFPARRLRRARAECEVATTVALDADDGGASASRATAATYVLLILCRDAAGLDDTLRSLLELPADRTHVVVVDHGSDDATAAVALAHSRQRVTVIQRQSPHARTGRGPALRAGVRMLRRMRLADPDCVVVGVLAQDGRVAEEALAELDRRFADPSVLGTRLRASTGKRRRRDRREDEIRALAECGPSPLAWLERGQGRFIRLSALESAPPGG